ncbi:sensor histidine kinase [Microbacterium oleivorans]|uniref:histidine kinase n=1 Tax=Microbacterium oleivorans TaxID=273677 RepID=A0A7D5EZK4_9MICO|nr:histidine kinase [Microbacterium oleivorans]QLD12468.1 histidine kinase [Microbacterium oleivorans]
MSSPGRAAPPTRLRATLPPILVAAVAVGYLGLALWGEALPTSVFGDVSPLVHGGLVLVQAVALLWRRRSPLSSFAVVVAADLAILATTDGELGIGALGVMLASYAVAREGRNATRVTALACGATATAVVGAASMAAGSGATLVVLVATAVARIGLLYVLPAAAAEYARGRERLSTALHTQARMVEAERRAAAERQVRAERAALARELHDIAGHHLSGIIVGAQAASALLTTDPERARGMLHTVQDDARTTLVDLRRTVGLLRDDDEPSSPARVNPTATVTGITALVAAARERGQGVDLETVGEPRTLGPLAETAAYRMVQESLANAARHAPSAPCHVSVNWTSEGVSVTVRNEPGDVPDTTLSPREPEGYGLAGMTERADLVGATVETGPAADGGWTNRMFIPTALADAS